MAEPIALLVITTSGVTAPEAASCVGVSLASLPCAYAIHMPPPSSSAMPVGRPSTSVLIWMSGVTVPLARLSMRAIVPL